MKFLTEWKFSATQLCQVLVEHSVLRTPVLQKAVTRTHLRQTFQPDSRLQICRHTHTRIAFPLPSAWHLAFLKSVPCACITAPEHDCVTAYRDTCSGLAAVKLMFTAQTLLTVSFKTYALIIVHHFMNMCAVGWPKQVAVKNKWYAELMFTSICIDGLICQFVQVAGSFTALPFFPVSST
jgi:hypothetical protein